MKLSLRKCLIGSQLIFFTPLFICCIIRPGVWIHNGGISNYGNYLDTLAFYVIAFSGNVAFLYLAAVKLQTVSGINKLGAALKWLCLVETLVLASTFPRHFSFTFSYIHDYLGIAQFIIEFFVSLYIVRQRFSRYSIGLLAVQITGSLIGLFSALHIFSLLFDGQTIGALGFGLILITRLPNRRQPKAVREHPAPEPAS